MEYRNAMPKKLLWLDLEMTGLDPSSCRIIEIAAIVTDFDMKELDTYEEVIYQPEEVLESADTWVKENLGANGLFDQVRSAKKNEKQVQKEFSQLIEKHFDRAAIIAGSSIHQDRRFIRQWWPDVEAKLHYRMLDVTTLKVFMMGKYKFMADKRESHRALDDIRGSIEEFNLYIEKLKS